MQSKITQDALKSIKEKIYLLMEIPRGVMPIMIPGKARVNQIKQNGNREENQECTRSRE